MAFLTQEGKSNNNYADEVAGRGVRGRVGGGSKQQQQQQLAVVADAQDPHRGELEALVFGVTQTSQSTLLLKKRKEMREVDEALAFMKEEFKARMEACEERQRDFEAKQHEMKEQVAKFEKFVQENDAKRTRAEAKSKLEAKLRVQHEEKLAKLAAKLGCMQEERDGLEADLQRLQQYQHYLESSVDASEGEYEEIPDLLNRYQTLRDANRDLTRVVGEDESAMDQIRSQLHQLRRETQNQLLVNNSKIHSKQKTLEDMRAKAIKADNERELGDRITKDRHRELGQVLMSIKNLHARCVATSRTSKARNLKGNTATVAASASASPNASATANTNANANANANANVVPLPTAPSTGSAPGGAGGGGPSDAKPPKRVQKLPTLGQLADLLKVIQFRIADLDTMDTNFRAAAQPAHPSPADLLS